MDHSKKQLIFHWSGGKDSMMALHYLCQDSEYEIAHLLTNFSALTDRVSMHGVRKSLLQKQSSALGYHLDIMSYEADQYKTSLSLKLNEAFQQGVQYIGYGDIFLVDLKQYRDEHLAQHQLTGVYPLWGRKSDQLAREFIDLGYKAIVVCINGQLLDPSFAGRQFDHQFLQDIPENIDPCGENGEFHTFVYDGPLFQRPVPYLLDETVEKKYQNPTNSGEAMSFWFADILSV